MNESNKRNCKACKVDKDRILAGKFPGPGGNKKWVDNENKLWSGNTCPECNTKRVKEVMQKTRSMSHE